MDRKTTDGFDDSGNRDGWQDQERGEGDISELLPLVYADLKRMCQRAMRGERPNHTLQSTDLVNEVLCKLLDAPNQVYNGPKHLYATAVRNIRRVLVDHAKNRNRIKDPRNRVRHEVREDHSVRCDDFPLILTVDLLIRQLDAVAPRQARATELHYFGGWSIKEIASELGVSERTVKDDLRISRAYLKARLQDGDFDEAA